MKPLLWAAALAVPAFALTPNDARAFGINPNCAHGYGWLQAKALNKFAWIHMEGPLYNYGPYCGGVGYVQRHYPYIGYHHNYVPAYPGAYAQGAGYYGYGNAYAYPNGYPQQPVAQYPGTPANPAAPAVPGAPVAPPTAAPAVAPAPAPTASYPTYPAQAGYPPYLGQVWPGAQR